MKKMNGNKLYKIKILLIDYNYLFNSYLKICLIFINSYLIYLFILA